MFKRIALGFLVLLVVIQFIRPARNFSAAPPGPDDFFVRFSPPPAVRQVLERACLDCHSNTTHYPWYDRIQPVAWWLAHHVNEGRRELNFSEFGTYTTKRQGRKLDAISDQMTNHEMPLKSYTWMHREARLTEAEINTVTAWIDNLHDQVAPAE